jgi:hypothetical protein
MKNTKRLLLTTVFFAAIFAFSACAFQVPNAQAAEMSLQEKSLSILNDVAGFNMTAYAPTLRTSRQSSFLTLPKEVNDFTLVSGDSSCRAMCTFVNNRLQQVYMSNFSGQPKMNQASLNTLESAKAFMARYDAYIVDFDCSAMRSLLDSIQTAENVTKEVGNTSLMVTVIDQSYVSYIWTYMGENGALAPSKNLAVSYRDGFLKCFQNNWQFYSVASKPEISSSQAVEIAMNAINDYSEMVVMPDNTTKPVSGFKVHSIGQTVLNYQNCREADLARGGDPFTLYPTWIVPLGFDNIYDGGINGAYVRLWADTGEVNDISHMKAGYPYIYGNESNSAELSGTFGILLTIAVLGCGTICLKWKHATWLSAKAARKHYARFAAILLCATVSVSVVSAGFSTAEASSAAYVYASLYYQVQDEVEAAEYVCDYIDGLFDDAGYNSVVNAYGEGTIKDDILSNAEGAEDAYDFVTVFHFGHMNGSCCYFDNDGTTVYYQDVDDYTTQGKHYFAFMWVCWSAYNDSLADAWCHDLYDDYHCYLGFYKASLSLESVSYTYHWGTPFVGGDVVCLFYYYALEYGYNIYDACDQMCWDLVGCGIEDMDSVAHFLTYWAGGFPGGPGAGWYEGGLSYYGNADIYLV